MLIQYILVSVIVLLFLVSFKNINAQRIKAGKRLFFVLFVALVIFSVFNPELFTVAAKKVGIGRGADLLLYLLLVSFFFVTLNTYLKFKDLEDKLVEVGRAVAIENSNKKDKE